MFTTKLITIPEFDFGDWGEIQDKSLVEMNYDGGITQDFEIKLTFNSPTLDTYTKLTDNIVNNNNQFNEMVAFTGHYENVIIYSGCEIDNMNVEANHSDLRMMTMNPSSRTITYSLIITLRYKNSVEMKTLMFNRLKKMKKILNKINDLEST